MEIKTLTRQASHKLLVKQIAGIIEHRLGIETLQQQAHCFETGIAFIKELTKEYPGVDQQMQSSRIFWAWWRNQWFMRNCFLVRQITSGDDREYLVGYYNLLHNINQLTNVEHPIFHSYYKLINNFLEHEKA